MLRSMLLENLAYSKKTDNALLILSIAYPHDWMEVRDSLIENNYISYCDAFEDSFEMKRYSALEEPQKEVYYLMNAIQRADIELSQSFESFVTTYGSSYNTKLIDFELTLKVLKEINK